MSLLSAAEYHPYTTRPSLLGSLAVPEPALPPERLQPEVPELALWRAVLVQAINDARLPPPYTHRHRHLRIENEAKADALTWLNSTEEQPYSSRWVCELIRIDHAGVLRLLDMPVTTTIAAHNCGDSAFTRQNVRRGAGRAAHTLRDRGCA